MTDYTCPNCHGSFPTDDSLGSRDACPWCEQEFGEYDPPDAPHAVSKVESRDGRDDGQPQSLIDFLRGDSE